jgi:hypothetical protein
MRHNPAWLRAAIANSPTWQGLGGFGPVHVQPRLAETEAKGSDSPTQRTEAAPLRLATVAGNDPARDRTGALESACATSVCRNVWLAAANAPCLCLCLLHRAGQSSLHMIQAGARFQAEPHRDRELGDSEPIARLSLVIGAPACVLGQPARPRLPSKATTSSADRWTRFNARWPDARRPQDRQPHSHPSASSGSMKGSESARGAGAQRPWALGAPTRG